MAYIDKNDDRELIADLQLRLYGLSQLLDEDELYVGITGVFDEPTEKAVRHYQRTRGLPVTGVVEIQMWEKLDSEYRDAAERYGKSRGIRPFPDTRGHMVRAGERSTLVFVIQIILNELRLHYDSYGYLPLNGKFDIATSEAVREFQNASGLEATGEIDRVTWNRLADEYNLAVREGNT